jgi:hypothetical protein
VFGRAEGTEHLLIDCVLERSRVGEDAVLYVHWLALRDPRARFAPGRERLPGQEVPGLGMAREMTELLTLVAKRLELAGVAFKPAWYHSAYLARDRYQFVDPAVQGRFEAMVRDFAGISLMEVSRAMAEQRIRLNGDMFRWQAETMARWLDDRERDDKAVSDVRDRSAFTIAPPEAE